MKSYRHRARWEERNLVSEAAPVENSSSLWAPYSHITALGSSLDCPLNWQSASGVLWWRGGGGHVLLEMAKWKEQSLWLKSWNMNVFISMYSKPLSFSRTHTHPCSEDPGFCYLKGLNKCMLPLNKNVEISYMKNVEGSYWIFTGPRRDSQCSEWGLPGGDTSRKEVIIFELSI